MNLRLQLILLILLTSFAVQSQLELQTCVTTSRNPWEWPAHNNWWVSEKNGGVNEAHMINFTGGTYNYSGDLSSATPLDNQTWINQYEGITAASNDLGGLVYFSSGRLAWDSTGQVTATDLNEGNEGGTTGIRGSAAQGIIGVRHPLAPKKYFAVTVGDVIGGVEETGYVVLDETGAQTETFTGLGLFNTEAITATLHANGVDIWVIVHDYGGANINALLLKCDGKFDPPIISAIGPSVVLDEGRGGMAMSWDGNLMAMNYAGQNANQYRQVMLYDFDKKTGLFSNRRDIVPWGEGIGGYDVIFSKDNTKLYVSGFSAFGDAVKSFDVTSGIEATIAATLKGGLGAAYVGTNTGLSAAEFRAMEYGADGNLYLNGLGGMYVWNEVSNATKLAGKVGTNSSQGLPNMYMPPAEEPDIEEVGPFCDTSAVEDIHTYWVCSGESSEDTLFNRHDYFLLDSNDVKSGSATPGIDPNSGTIIGQKTGIFNPKLAGAGTHRIVFEYCDVNDTIDILVTKCGGCQDTLKNVLPNLCVGDNPLLLDTMITAASADGVWTIDSFPGFNAVLTEVLTDTLFDASNLSTKEGLHKLMFTVTDGSEICKDSIYIKVNKLPIASVDSNAICLNDPAVTLTATVDSLVNAVYTWSELGAGTGNQTTVTASDSGIYKVDVVDLNGCATSAIGHLMVNKLPVVVVDSNAICLGDVAVTLTATVDSSVFSYTWSGLGSGIFQTVSAIDSGDYVVNIVDDNGCTGSGIGYLMVNQLPVVTVNNDTICAGDAAAVFTASSTSPNLIYTWSDNGFGNAVITSDIVAGDYSVEVEDMNGCKAAAKGALIVNKLPVVLVNDSTICAGSLVSAEFTANSDTTATSYLWSVNGTGTNSTTSGTTPGDYTVTVTDKNGCISSGTGVLKLSVLPVLTVDSSEICLGDAAATFNVSSDSTVSTYAWSVNGSGTNPTATGTAPGNYTVNIIDVNGCIGTATGLLTVHDLPVITLNGGNVCPNTLFTLTPTVTSNNLPLLSSSWDSGEATPTIQKGAGTYVVTVTDTKGCVQTASATVIEDPNLSVKIPGPIELCQGEDTLLISNYKAVDGYDYVWSMINGPDTVATNNVTESLTADSTGIYHLAVSKGNCKGDTSVLVTVHDLPTVVVGDEVICDDGTIATFTTATTTDPGTTISTYAWADNGSGSATTTTGTTPGDYSVIVTDGNGCTATDKGVLTVNTLPTVTVNDAEICTGGTAANFTAVSATATSYLWSINATGAGSTKTGTAAGDYKVIVTDINGCTATDTGVLTVNILPVAAVTSTGICIGDPAASFTASADSAIASYLWSENGAGTNSTTSGTAAGNYTVQITDIHGCVDSETGVLTVNPLPVVGNTPKVLCTGDPAVIVGEVVSGGPYNYSWVETGESTATISVTVGNMTYNRNVENIATGCKASSGYLVTENVNPSVNVDDDTKCTGDAMTLFDTFSSVGYSYIWDPGQIPTATIQPTSNQIYTITKINDATGCSNTTTGRATFVAIPNASIAPDTVTVCQGDPASLFVTHDATSLQWSDGSNTDYTSVFTQGMYTAVASNGGCPAKDSVYVKVIEYPVSQLSKAIEGELICFEELDRVLTLTAHTNENLTYLWGAGETTSTIAVEAKGTYNVSISNGSCTIEDLVTIYTYCPWTLFVPNAFSPEGPGGNLNNTFSAKGTNIVEFVMTVYDRWGLKIYETKDLHNGWDGTYKSHLVQSDVYVWKINFSVESKTGNLSDHSRVGTVTVVR